MARLLCRGDRPGRRRARPHRGDLRDAGGRQHNAWGRFSGLGNPYDLVRVEPLRSAGRTDGVLPRPDRQAFAFVDPAFVTASCRFSLANGPVRISAEASPTTFWSASIYDRQGDNLYSINDRSAVEESSTSWSARATRSSTPWPTRRRTATTRPSRSRSR